jgi:hypothetical protein
LISEFTVCEKGKTLSPEQSRILKFVECFVTNKDTLELIETKKNGVKSGAKLKKSMKAKDKVKKLKSKNQQIERDSDEESMELDE